jgi:hypothetical protein
LAAFRYGWARGEAIALVQGEIGNGQEREKAMFRIHIHDCDEAASFILEGRLVGPWVRELENCWQRARAAEPRKSILVNLAEVSFVDSDGIDLLTRLCGQGISLASTGLMMGAIVEQIEKKADKPKPL